MDVAIWDNRNWLLMLHTVLIAQVKSIYINSLLVLSTRLQLTCKG